jgi:hypothetical protein
MTRKHNNVAKIIVKAIETINWKYLSKSITERYIHWNQELRLPNDINNPRENPEFFNIETSKKKSI